MHANNPHVKTTYPHANKQPSDGKYYRIYRLASHELDCIKDGVYKGHFILAAHFTRDRVYVFTRRLDD
jgi:hypothetical protein